jgi:hypothetical protein
MWRESASGVRSEGKTSTKRKSRTRNSSFSIDHAIALPIRLFRSKSDGVSRPIAAKSSRPRATILSSNSLMAISILVCRSFQFYRGPSQASNEKAAPPGGEAARGEVRHFMTAALPMAATTTGAPFTSPPDTRKGS